MQAKEKKFTRKLSVIFSTLILSIGFCNHSLAFCNMSPHAWTSVEYLYGWSQNSPINVPLVTKNDNFSALGLIGEPGTQIIFGAGSNKDSFNWSGMTGARLTIGDWLD